MGAIFGAAFAQHASRRVELAWVTTRHVNPVADVSFDLQLSVASTISLLGRLPHSQPASQPAEQDLIDNDELRPAAVGGPAKEPSQPIRSLVNSDEISGESSGTDGDAWVH